MHLLVGSLVGAYTSILVSKEWMNSVKQTESQIILSYWTDSMVMFCWHGLQNLVIEVCKKVCSMQANDSMVHMDVVAIPKTVLF